MQSAIPVTRRWFVVAALALLTAFSCLATADRSRAVAPIQVSPDDGATVAQFDYSTLKMQWCAPASGNRLGIRILLSRSNATDANGVLSSTIATQAGDSGGYCFLELRWRAVDAGAYYWQVTNTVNGVLEKSPIRTLTVQPAPAMEPEWPPNGGRYLTSSRFSLQIRNVPLYYDFPALSAFYVASSPTVDAKGELVNKIATEWQVKYLKQGGWWVDVGSSSYPRTPGTYYWQYKAVSTDRGSPVAYSPVFSFTITAGGSTAPAGPTSTRIPLSVGRQGTLAFKVNHLSNIPAGVSGARFLELARSAGTRWGLTYQGPTVASPGVRDKVNVVGFSAAGAAASLGTTRNLGVVRRKVAARGCRRVDGIRKCRVPARWKTERELDVFVDTSVRWQQGPTYPTVDEFDLETLLIHEFGHVADFGRDLHFTGCLNSPMVKSMGPGEWWRSSTDWRRPGC